MDPCCIVGFVIEETHSIGSVTGVITWDFPFLWGPFLPASCSVWELWGRHAVQKGLGGFKSTRDVANSAEWGGKSFFRGYNIMDISKWKIVFGRTTVVNVWPCQGATLFWEWFCKGGTGMGWSCKVGDLMTDLCDCCLSLCVFHIIGLKWCAEGNAFWCLVGFGDDIYCSTAVYIGVSFGILYSTIPNCSDVPYDSKNLGQVVSLNT